MKEKLKEKEIIVRERDTASKQYRKRVNVVNLNNGSPHTFWQQRDRHETWDHSTSLDLWLLMK